ncbi:MAG: DNA polymerase III subunit delta [Hyphomicrobiales bacterium]|nr:MAG: DNA polymerase III subunit delta [Hyphomicrobiales bacterium]
MAVLKGPALDRFLKEPDPSVGFVLVYGPDVGLVSERCKAIANAATKGSSDPFALIRLDSSEIDADSNRLADEALQIALFGDRRTVWVRAGGRGDLAGMITPLMHEPPENTLILVEAGDLKKGVALRRRFEENRGAVAIACYPDEAGDLNRLIDDETAAVGLAIDSDASQALHALIGGDRLASRSEVAKLCLYARDSGRITLADVEVSVGDASALAASEVIDAMFLGEIDTVVRGLDRLTAAGQSVSGIGTNALRHLHMLHRMRAEIEAGAAADAVMNRARPPIYFRRKPLISRALQRWNTMRLERAMTVLSEAIHKTRLYRDLEEAVLADAMITIARAGRRPA